MYFLLFRCITASQSLEEGTNKYRSVESLLSGTDPHIVKVHEDLNAIPAGEVDTLTINLSFNYIKYIPSYVFFTKGYRKLNKIELQNNQVSNIHKYAFKSLANLKEINLSDNNITSLETVTFKSNKMLEKLDLTSNKINFNAYFFLNSLSLETLILTDNRIERIYERTFYKLPKLRNLHLDKNFVFVIETSSFEPLKHLQFLSLAHTTVDKLTVNMFRNNHTLPSVLDVTDTPLANKFNPPLSKLDNESVRKLVNIDNLF